MASIVSTQTGNFNTGSTWVGGVAPVAGDDATIQSSHVVTQVQNEACAGIVVDSGGTWDQATYNMVNSSTTVSNGTYTIGISAGVGLTTTGLTIGNSSTWNVEQLSVFAIAGDFIIGTSVTVTQFRGTFVISATGNLGFSTSFYCYDFTQDASITTTLTSGTNLTGIASIATNINGTIACGANQIRIGASASGVVTMGSGSDVSGSGNVDFYSANGATYTNNMAGAWSHTGTIKDILSGSTLLFPAWDFSNADVERIANTASNPERLFASGTLKCKNLTLVNAGVLTTIVDCDTNNPNFEVSGAINFVPASGVVTWSKGTGTMKFTGTAQSINLNGQLTETIFSTSSIGAVTILAADTWDIGTLDLTTGLITINGTFIESTTVTNGLVCVGLTINSGASIDMQIGSIVSNSGSYSCHNSVVWVNNHRGELTLTASANYVSTNGNNRWYSLTINSSVITTITGTTVMTGGGSGVTDVQGTLAMGVNDTTLGVSTSGTFTLGVSADITGSADLTVLVYNSSTITWSLVSALSFTGVWRYSGSASTTALICEDMSNNSVEILSVSAASPRISRAGILSCVNFTINSTSGFTNSVSNIANNPSFVISGDINLNLGSGSTAWTAGTSTLQLAGTAQSVDLNGLITETIFSTSSIGAVTVLAADTWNLGTLDLETALFTINGGIVMGVTATTGLTCNGVTINSGAAVDLQTTSLIFNSGNYFCDGSSIFTTAGTGKYTQVENGNFDNQNSSNTFDSFIVNVGKTLTISAGKSYITRAASSTEITINGTIAVNNALELSGSSTTAITFGASSNITGSSTLTYIITSAPLSYTNNQSSAFSFTGIVLIQSSNSSTRYGLTADYSNAEVRIQGTGTGDSTVAFTSGTLYSDDFTITSTVNNDVGLDNSINDTSFIINGNTDLNAGVGTYITVWTKGTGTITFTGVGKVADLDNQTTEEISVPFGASITIVGDFKPTNTNVGGTLFLVPTATNTTGNITGSGTMESTTAATVFFQYTGVETFSGTLTRVVLVGPFGQNNFNLDPIDYPKAGYYTIERIT